MVFFKIIVLLYGQTLNAIIITLKHLLNIITKRFHFVYLMDLLIGQSYQFLFSFDKKYFYLKAELQLYACEYIYIWVCICVCTRTRTRTCLCMCVCAQNVFEFIV